MLVPLPTDNLSASLWALTNCVCVVFSFQGMYTYVSSISHRSLSHHCSCLESVVVPNFIILKLPFSNDSGFVVHPKSDNVAVVFFQKRMKISPVIKQCFSIKKHKTSFETIHF